MDKISHYEDEDFDSKYFGIYYKKYNKEELGFKVSAIEISKFMIKKAKGLQSYMNFKVENIQRNTGKDFNRETAKRKIS